MSLDLPGFADPVLDAQRCFRAVLDAISRPGLVGTAGEALTPPAPLAPATAAVLLTLVDPETKLFLDPEAEPAADWIAFHCGAPRVTAPRAADFALGLSVPPALGDLDPGTHESPETSATLILQVDALGTGTSLRLTGPGIDGSTTLRVAGLPSGFIVAWGTNHAGFPCGIDVILCAGTRLAALPRSLRIEEAG